MGSVCCLEKKDNDEILEARKPGGNNQNKAQGVGVGIKGPNPFMHRPGQGYEEQRAMKEAKEAEEA